MNFDQSFILIPIGIEVMNKKYIKGKAKEMNQIIFSFGSVIKIFKIAFW